MKLGGKTKGLIGFVAIVVLVAGGLGWATRAALGLEREQLRHQAAAEHAEKLRLAMWRLDGRISAILAREDSRPFHHYSAIFAPPLALDHTCTPAPAGSVLEPSPLLQCDLPPWMLLHFQTDPRGWESPQVLSPTLRKWLAARPNQVSLSNVTTERKQHLAELSRAVPAASLLSHAKKHAGATRLRDRVVLARRMEFELQQQAANPYGNVSVTNSISQWSDYASRGGMSSKLNLSAKANEQKVPKDLAYLSIHGNGEEWLHAFQGQLVPGENRYNLRAPMTNNSPASPLLRLPASAEVNVSMSPMVGLWLPAAQGPARLVALRLVRLEEKDVCQGVLLDGDGLADLLAEEVRDLFPEASVVPAGEPSPATLAETMTTLPLRLAAGEVATPDDPGWTTLRLGLATAWAAALIALLAVGLGGWSLLDLSERRIRFVSAVTHELRTPLTTLRLYLDMLLGGLVRDEAARQEYLRTLEGETDRLTRLVGNVLDFSRLENQQPRLSLGCVHASEVLGAVAEPWRGRCANAGKELVVEDATGGAALLTDSALLGQILGNLIDNACKYSREAADRHVWLRGRVEGTTVIFEVEDRGPGVPPGERRVIFRPFRRGRASDATTGGVGLGLALAARWARLLGGRLRLCSPDGGGACFRVELLAGK